LPASPQPSVYYVNDSVPGRECTEIKLAMRRLLRLYGKDKAQNFGPLALKAVRPSMVDSGLMGNLTEPPLDNVISTGDAVTETGKNYGSSNSASLGILPSSRTRIAGKSAATRNGGTRAGKATIPNIGHVEAFTGQGTRLVLCQAVMVHDWPYSARPFAMHRLARVCLPLSMCPY
jgi:hypothetical protein